MAKAYLLFAVLVVFALQEASQVEALEKPGEEWGYDWTDTPCMKDYAKKEGGVWVSTIETLIEWGGPCEKWEDELYKKEDDKKEWNAWEKFAWEFDDKDLAKWDYWVEEAVELKNKEDGLTPNSAGKDDASSSGSTNSNKESEEKGDDKKEDSKGEAAGKDSVAEGEAEKQDGESSEGGKSSQDPEPTPDTTFTHTFQPTSTADLAFLGSNTDECFMQHRFTEPYRYDGDLGLELKCSICKDQFTELHDYNKLVEAQGGAHTTALINCKKYTPSQMLQMKFQDKGANKVSEESEMGKNAKKYWEESCCITTGSMARNLGMSRKEWNSKVECPFEAPDQQEECFQKACDNVFPECAEKRVWQTLENANVAADHQLNQKNRVRQCELCINAVRVFKFNKLEKPFEEVDKSPCANLNIPPSTTAAEKLTTEELCKNVAATVESCHFELDDYKKLSPRQMCVQCNSQCLMDEMQQIADRKQESTNDDAFDPEQQRKLLLEQQKTTEKLKGALLKQLQALRKKGNEIKCNVANGYTGVCMSEEECDKGGVFQSSDCEDDSKCCVDAGVIASSSSMSQVNDQSSRTSDVSNSGSETTQVLGGGSYTVRSTEDRGPIGSGVTQAHGQQGQSASTDPTSVNMQGTGTVNAASPNAVVTTPQVPSGPTTVTQVGVPLPTSACPNGDARCTVNPKWPGLELWGSCGAGGYCVSMSHCAAVGHPAPAPQGVQGQDSTGVHADCSANVQGILKSPVPSDLNCCVMN